MFNTDGAPETASLLKKFSYQELYTQTVQVVVNLTVKCDKPDIQMQVNDDSEAKSKAADTTRRGAAGTATIAKFGGHSFPLPPLGRPAFITDDSMTILINELLHTFVCRL
jgi:hypothetical protein